MAERIREVIYTYITWQQLKDEKPQPVKSTTLTAPSQVAITTDIILNAKERLRKSSSTARKGLSTDNADFPREKINEISESHKSDTSDDDWEYKAQYSIYSIKI